MKKILAAVLVLALLCGTAVAEQVLVGEAPANISAAADPAGLVIQDMLPYMQGEMEFGELDAYSSGCYYRDFGGDGMHMS